MQRAFHYAGAKNVVCSLWKVPDASTAALMALFYRNLWEKNLTPLEAGSARIRQLSPPAVQALVRFNPLRIGLASTPRRPDRGNI